MPRRRLPRSWRGRALPRSSSGPVTWPKGLQGRSPALCLLVLGWLGGGLAAVATAIVTGSADDLAYGRNVVAGAVVGLLLLVVAGLRDTWQGRPVAPVPVRIPVQADRRSTVLR